MSSFLDCHSGPTLKLNLQQLVEMSHVSSLLGKHNGPMEAMEETLS